jgi:hypothetical protein
VEETMDRVASSVNLRRVQRDDAVFDGYFCSSEAVKPREHQETPCGEEVISRLERIYDVELCP